MEASIILAMGATAGRKILVMGIVNITDDSFFAASRQILPDGSFDEGRFAAKVAAMLEEGADIIDIGACSTRPGSDPVPAELEWERLSPALRRFAADFPGARLSIDTFRPEMVRKAHDIAGPFMVNDVSGGCPAMWETVSSLGLPYIAMHTKGTPKTMQDLAVYDDVTRDVRSFFEDFSRTASEYGIEDWILDPGFGFAKTVEQNWQLLREMSLLREFRRPIMAGLSRKSFIYKPLGLTPEEALAPTQAANFAALEGGATILRVHDIAQTLRTIKLFLLYSSPSSRDTGHGKAED